METNWIGSKDPASDEKFLTLVGAYGWDDIRGQMGSVGRLFDTPEMVELPLTSPHFPAKTSARISLAHLAALRFLWHDLALLFDLNDLPAGCSSNALPAHMETGLANLRTVPFSLASVYGQSNLAGNLARQLEKAQRWPWDNERMWLGYMGRDLLRLSATVWDDRAPLSEAFFDDLPSHLRQRFFQDEDLAGHIAIVPEPRNDRSLLLSQFHVSILSLHNAFVSDSEKKQQNAKDPETLFQDAQLRTRHSFQAMVLGDLIPRICLPGGVASALVRVARLYQDRSKTLGTAFFPIEAAVLFEVLLGSVHTDRFYPNKAHLLAGQHLEKEDYEAVADGLPRRLMNSPRIPMHMAPEFFLDWPIVLEAGTRSYGQDVSLPQSFKNVAIASGQSAASTLNLPVLSPSDVAKTLGQPLRQATPLSDYLVAETLFFTKNGRLGPLGSFILTETLVGLLGGRMAHLLSAPYRRLDNFLTLNDRR